MTGEGDAPRYPLAENIATRFSSRRFSGEPLPDETIETLLEAARWAPSYGNRQPWRFIVAREEGALNRVRDALTRGNAYAKAAPILIVQCGAPEDGQIVDGKEHYLMDGGLALENLLLQATSMGLHTHPMGGFDEAGVREALGIPEHVRVLAVTAIGYPGRWEDLDERTLEREMRPRSRKPIDEVRAYDRWEWT